MRRAIGTLVLIVVVGLASAGTAGGDHAASRRARVGGLSIAVPPGWHVLHGWLSDVIDPAPRLALASFPARLSRHTCECGFPNVVRFPRDGAFMFVWEYLHASRRGLARTPSRPLRFDLAGSRAVRLTCDGSSDTFAFKAARRIFQVEVYLGPKAGRVLRSQMTSALDSLRATAGFGDRASARPTPAASSP